MELPSLDDVAASDILPFARNRGAPWLMTAHIRYMQRDTASPATLSPSIIAGVIRAPDAIGFDGVLVSDDLAMGALSGSPGSRAARAIAAGCDIALHCSGVLEETRDVLESVTEASEACLDRLARAREMARNARQTLEVDRLHAERAALLA
jgi:beta-N-acetylhexosaminidase